VCVCARARARDCLYRHLCRSDIIADRLNTHSNGETKLQQFRRARTGGLSCRIILFSSEGGTHGTCGPEVLRFSSKNLGKFEKQGLLLEGEKGG
jgi:hypothetical protein